MTRQRKALLSFLSVHPDEMLSAQEIADALSAQDISLSAVYRNLTELETEGKVRRNHRGTTREVYFQYMDLADCKSCLHLSCTKCGRTFHMNAAGAKRLTETVAEADGFALDRAETILYGVCGPCQHGKG